MQKIIAMPSYTYQSWHFWYENIPTIWQPCNKVNHDNKIKFSCSQFSAHWPVKKCQLRQSSNLDSFTTSVPGSVARWYIFKPKIQIWVNLGRSCAMEDIGIFSTILSILRLNGIFFGHFVHLGIGNLVYIFPFWYVVP
jgi:hypothetical protein